MNHSKQLSTIQNEALELFNKKNTDYGDAFANYGPVGVLVRIGDKISRLQNIEKNNITMINDEKIRDTLIDLHNYAAMAIMLIDEKEKLTTKLTTKVTTNCDCKYDGHRYSKGHYLSSDGEESEISVMFN